jgi:hypothetical protein
MKKTIYLQFPEIFIPLSKKSVTVNDFKKVAVTKFRECCPNNDG